MTEMVLHRHHPPQRARGDGEATEARLHKLERLLAQREAELRQAAIVRRALHNAVQELKGNIRVFCRVRPPANDEDPRATRWAAVERPAAAED